MGKRSIQNSSNNRLISSHDEETKLRRRLSLPLLILYGLGVTIGAGIYVLIGASAGRAGMYAPVSFVLAAAVMGLTAASFSELSGRIPVSAGEAAYVRAGFNSNILSLIVGLMVIVVGSVSASAIAIGSAGYIRVFIDISTPIIAAAVVVFMGTIAIVGILESVAFAAAMTIIEIVGLLFVVVSGVYFIPDIGDRFIEVIPVNLDLASWSGILAAGLLAFFAFVGFEDLVNVAEEVREPERTMPAAIFYTLLISAVIYFLVVSVSVMAVPPMELAESKAPLGLVFKELTGSHPALISSIAIVATLNGIIVQIIMASRVMYGLTEQGNLPGWLGKVNPLTHTPLNATIVVTAFILFLALNFPMEDLAETTSSITLAIFSLVNIALVRIKLAGMPAPEGTLEVYSWVPWAGFATCLIFLITGFIF